MMLRTNYRPPPKVVVNDNSSRQYTSISKKDIEFEALVQEEMRKIENNLKKEINIKSNNDNNDIEVYMPNSNRYDVDALKMANSYIPNSNYSRPATEWDGLKPTTSETNVIPIKITFDDKSRPQTEWDDNINNNIDSRLPNVNSMKPISLNQPRRKGDLINLHEPTDRLNSKAARAALYASQLQQQVLEKQKLEQQKYIIEDDNEKYNSHDYRKNFVLAKQAEYRQQLDADQRRVTGYVPIPPPTLKQNFPTHQDTKHTGLLIGQMNISSAESRTIKRKQQMMYNQQLLRDINTNTRTNIDNEAINDNSTKNNTKNNTNMNTYNNANIPDNRGLISNNGIGGSFNNNEIDNRLADYIRSLERENEDYRKNMAARIGNPSNNFHHPSEPANPTSSSYVEEKSRARPTLQFKLADDHINNNEEKKLPSIKVTTTTETDDSSKLTKDPPKSPTKARMKLLTDVYGSSAFSSMSGMDLPTNPAPSSSAEPSSTSNAAVYDPKSPPKSPTKARLMKYNEVYGKTQLFDDEVEVPVKSKVKSPNKARMRMMSDVYGVGNFNSGTDDATINASQSITHPIRHDVMSMDQKSGLAEQIAEKKRIKAEEKLKERLADEEDERRVKRELEELGEYERSIKATKRAEAEEITKEMMVQQEKQFQKALLRKGKITADAIENSESPTKKSFLKIKAPPKASPNSKLPPKVDISPIKMKPDEAYYDRSSSLPHLAPHQPIQQFYPVPNPRQFAEDNEFNSIVDRFRPSSSDEVDSFLVNWQRQQYQSLATAHKYPAMQQQQWPAFPPNTDKKGGMRDMAATGVIQFSVESRFISNDAGVMNDGLLTALGATAPLESPKELAGKSVNIIAGQEEPVVETSTALLSDSSLLYGEYQNNDS